MKCIVTGGAGFIGSNLVDRLIDDGHEVIVLDNLSTGFEENINPKATHFGFDISHSNVFPSIKTFNLFEGVDAVFHMACLARVQPSIEDPLLYHNQNVNGVVNMLELCRIYGVKRFIFSSSSSVYGDAEQVPTTEECKLNPISPYALHKLIGEQYCKLYSELYGIETVSLRYFNVYGERQPTRGQYAPVVGLFIKQKNSGNPMTVVGDGLQTRDYTHVSDVVCANIMAAKSDSVDNGEIINIGCGKNYSVLELVEMVGKELGRPGYIFIPPRVGEVRHTIADISKANKLLEWLPKVELSTWIGENK